MVWPACVFCNKCVKFSSLAMMKTWTQKVYTWRQKQKEPTGIMTEILIHMHIMDAANVLLFVGSIVCASDYATSKHMLTTFDSSPENVSAIAGKTAILPCTVDLSNLDPTKEVCCCCCFRRRRRCCCCCCCCWWWWWWWWWWCFYLTSFFKYFNLFYVRIMIKATQNNSRHTFFFTTIRLH